MFGINYSGDYAEFSIDLKSLLADSYSLRVVVHKPGFNNYDDWRDITFFNVEQNNSSKNGFSYPGNWEAKQYVNNTWYKEKNV